MQFFQKVNLIISASLLIPLITSQLSASNFGTTSANFLKIGPGTRISAMADAGSALTDDANVLYWNPAGLAFIDKTDMQTTYLNQLEDIHFSQIGFAKSGGSGNFGFSGTTVFSTEIEGRNELDIPTNNFSFYNWSFAASYAKIFPMSIAAGLSLKIIRESIGNQKSDGIAFDFGLTHQHQGLILPDNVSNFSFTLQHVGPDLGPGKSSPLPITSRLGASHSFFSKKWIVATDLVIPMRGDLEFNLGNEWRLHPIFSLRAGYKFLHGDYRNTEWFKSLVGGIGFYFTPPTSQYQYNLDYAVSTMGNTGFSHRFSFGIKFL